MRAMGLRPSTSASWRMVPAASFCTRSIGLGVGPWSPLIITPALWMIADASWWT